MGAVNDIRLQRLLSRWLDLPRRRLAFAAARCVFCSTRVFQKSLLHHGRQQTKQTFCGAEHEDHQMNNGAIQ